MLNKEFSTSVAICTYNGAKYIAKQLESILSQELSVDEIIICDDGSIDNTASIATDYLGSHAKCRYKVEINETTLGVVKNFEKAILLCSGDFIFLSDQDDVWHSNKTSVILNYFIDHPDINVVFTDANLIGLNNEILTEHSLLDSVYLLPYLHLFYNGLQNEIFYSCNRATGATMSIRKSFISKVLPFNNTPFCLHDEQLAIRAIQNNCLGIILERLIDYRQHGTNVIGVPTDNWVYTGKSPENLLLSIARNRDIKEIWLSRETPRVRFFQLRVARSNSLSGKLWLLLHVPKYRLLYGTYWKSFLWEDLRWNLRIAFHLKKQKNE